MIYSVALQLEVGEGGGDGGGAARLEQHVLFLLLKWGTPPLTSPLPFFSRLQGWGTCFGFLTGAGQQNQGLPRIATPLAVLKGLLLLFLKPCLFSCSRVYAARSWGNRNYFNVVKQIAAASRVRGKVYTASWLSHEGVTCKIRGHLVWKAYHFVWNFTKVN